MQTLSQKAQKTIRSLALALGLALTALSGGALAADFDAPASRAPQSARTGTRPPGTQSIGALDRAGYQAREAASRRLEKFSGGDEILIVGPSVVGVVILVCILVILL